MTNNNITKTEYRQALEQSKIVIVGSKFTSNGWTEFQVYRIHKNELQPIEVPNAGYHKNFNTYKCTAWGTSRELEIILAIGYELGLDFHEIKQRYISLPR